MLQPNPDQPTIFVVVAMMTMLQLDPAIGQIFAGSNKPMGCY